MDTWALIAPFLMPNTGRGEGSPAGRMACQRWPSSSPPTDPGVRHVIPIHYGTFPLLAGTPDQLRAELAARGLGDVEVHAPEPGGSVS